MRSHYNYVYDPNVYLKRFFQEGVKGEHIFLVDEAHNLVERSREMYSASLYKEEEPEKVLAMATGEYYRLKHPVNWNYPNYIIFPIKLQ